MIYIGILDASEIDPSDSRVISKIPEDIRGRVEKTKDIRERKLRAGAYLVLVELAERFFDIQNPRILYTDKGKPYIRNCKNVNNSSQLLYNINISHDEDFSAVVVTDEDIDVGIDVQTLKGNISIKSVSKRFFDKCSALRNDAVPEVKNLTEIPSLINRSVSVLFFRGGDGGVFEAPYDGFANKNGNICVEDERFLKKWTYLESHIKMLGEGFSGLSSFDKISEGADCGSLEIFNKGKLYFICVAAKEKRT